MSDERRYAEELAVTLSAIGLPPAWGKLLGWMLICEPPRQSSTELAEALGLSKGSISTGMRMLERGGLVRRVGSPGTRGHVYEMSANALIDVSSDASRYRVMREVLDRGLKLLGDEDSPRARRLRVARDFYAFAEREVPAMVERFKREYGDA